jgi:hypothetical protein
MCATDHSYDPLLGDTAPTVPDDEVAAPHSTDAGHALKAARAIPALAGPAPAGMQSR